MENILNMDTKDRGKNIILVQKVWYEVSEK